MKLRIRSSETKETIRVEAPDSASLSDLKALIAAKLAAAAASSSAPPISAASIRLSLNRTDEVLPADPLAPLPSLGLTTGDLLFLSIAPISNPDPVDAFIQPSHPPPETMMEDAPNPNPEPVDAFIQPFDPPPEPMMEDTIQAVNLNPSLGEPDPEAGSSAGVSKLSLLVPKSPSFPFLLRRVMDAEMAMAEGGLGFLALGVHAAFLDSGFVVSGGNDWTRFPGGFVPSSNNISVQYTVPDLVGTCDAGGAENDGKVAVLKFSAIKNFASVYGIVGRDRSVVHHVCLDVERFVPSLLSTVEVMRWSDEKVVVEFSKVVMDKLCLPLMIDLCEKNGLPLPPCFLRLPTELKEKILELLPSVDLARTSCASSELRELSSSDKLWKQRFEKEFGELPAVEVRTSGTTFINISWKNKFGMHWRRMMQEAASIDPSLLLQSRGPRRPRWHQVIGGGLSFYPSTDYNQHLYLPAHRRFFSPMCSLGEGEYYQA